MNPIFAVHLDLKTLLVCLVLGNFFTLLLMLAYRSQYSKDATSKPFVIAKLLQLVILLLLESGIDGRFVFPIITLLGLAGGIAEAFALLKLLGVYTERGKRYYYALAGVSGVCLAALYLLFPEKLLYIASLSFAGALFLVYPAYLLCIKVKETPLQEIMGLLYGIVILAMLGRTAKTSLAPVLGSTAVAVFLQNFFYIGIYLLMFLGTAGFMLLSREQSYAELERAAAYDELTGILNRREFVLRARSLIAAAAREAAPFSFLLLDVDHFKRVNDTYGHDTGDKVLNDFACKIEQQLGNGDLFGRFGGEEFAVLLQSADETASDEIAERLRQCVLDAVIEGVPLSYTVSIGVITVVSGERVPLNTLYRLADAALYRAKQQGRNRVARSKEETSQ